MDRIEDLYKKLAVLRELRLQRQATMSAYTRFGLGGPAAILAETANQEALAEVLRAVQGSGLPIFILGNGTNLVVSDEGFPGIVVRWTASSIRITDCRIVAASGALWYHLVEQSIEQGLAGLQTLAGIPGTVGGAVYGNAGAYGHSISERVERIAYLTENGPGQWDHSSCGFTYRRSRFQTQKACVILETHLNLEQGSRPALRNEAGKILRLRREKFPEQMRCAGSVFKNLVAKDLPEETCRLIPPEAIREGKIPAGWFLERVGAKGLCFGGIRVTDYHANLIFNQGDGTAEDFFSLAQELKRRVEDRFGIRLEEEIRYVGNFNRLAKSQ